MGKKGKSANKYRKVEISHENIKRENRKAYKGIVFFSLILLTIVIGTSYALFSSVKTSEKKVEVQAGTFKISFLDSNYINLENTYPMTNEEGFNTTPYKFTIRNDGTLNAKYNISLEESEGNTLDKSYIRYRIKEGEGNWSEPTLLSNDTILLEDDGTLNQGEDINYELQLWLDEDAPNEVQGTKYQAKIVVSATQTNANIVNVAQPIINLYGASVVNIEQYTSFEDSGVSSIQAKEEIDVSAVTKRYEYFDGVNTTPVERVDTSKVGTYFIYYEVLDSNENKGLAIRIVNVYKADTTPPTITVEGESAITLDYDAEYKDQGARAQDTIDGDLTSKIVTVGEVNTKLEGTQIIKYLIIDSEGNTASVVRTVVVKRKYADVNGNFVYNKDLSDGTKQVYDINIQSSNTPLTYVITSNGEIPEDGEYKTIEELEIEGLAEDGRLVFKRNDDYVIWIKDSKGEVIKKELSVYGVDISKPTCNIGTLDYNSFDNEIFKELREKYEHHKPSIAVYGTEIVGVGIEKYLYITCTDPVGIEEKYLTDQVLTVTNPEVLKIVDISAPTICNGGYRYNITVTGLKPGQSNVVLAENSVFDKAGNGNEESTHSIDFTVGDIDTDYDSVTLDFSGETTKKIKVSGTNLGSGIEFISSNENVVRVQKDGDITATDAIMTAVAPGSATITVVDISSMAKKVINVKVVNTVTLTFTKGEGVEALTTTALSCTAEESMECPITLPTFTPEFTVKEDEGYEAIGWNADEYEGVGFAQGETINVSESATYYAIAIKPQNKNIKEVYTYNQTVGAANYCVTGKESTCQSNKECIETRTKDSGCPIGTIIKYEVKDGEEKVFYVLHDDGRRMTLQQRENTTQSEWYDGSADNTKGPLTALNKLDSVTSGWTNVRTQKYTMGTTDFLAHSTFAGTNYASIYTKCGGIGACNQLDGYTMAERTGKARFITLQEARAVCPYEEGQRPCPIWMYNYLQNSTQNDGTENDNTNGNNYHTMSSYETQHNWFMRSDGYFTMFSTNENRGIRAVIEIDK